MLPEIAEGDANKMWVIPTEFTAALQGITQGFTGGGGNGTPFNFGGGDDNGNSGTDADLGTNPFDEVDLADRSEEHTSELQSRGHLVCRLLLEKKKRHSK